ncbi:MAG: PQQ-binding-like beta-propeller repeat protein [Vicinamibacterales bacterium]
MLKSRGAAAVALMAVLGAGLTAAALSAEALATVENWSRFRGPNGTGVSTATNLPVEFGPQSHVKWKAAVPPGHSSPVFTDSHIFLSAHSAEKDDYKLFTLALERRTGKQLWQHEVPRLQKGRRENVNGPASPSPVTDGANVYFFFQDFGLISYTAEGQERWRLPLGPFNMFYGFGASPILEDGVLLLSVDQDTDPYLLAVDAKSGKEIWRVARPHVISGYSTPTIWRPQTGGAQILIPESFQLTAYAIADGKKIWWVRGLACEMKSVASIDADTLYVNGWGFGQNQAGT